MRICITAQNNDLNSEIDPRFGRCKYFIIVNTDTMEFEAIFNENATGTGGVGIQAGQLMAEKKVSSVITGNVGPNAFTTLKAANIIVYTNVKGSVINAIEEFKKNNLTKSNNPSVEPHSGMN